MTPCAPSCLNFVLKLPRMRAAAARNRPRLSFLPWLATGVTTILPPPRLNDT